MSDGYWKKYIYTADGGKRAIVICTDRGRRIPDLVEIFDRGIEGLADEELEEDEQ